MYDPRNLEGVAETMNGPEAISAHEYLAGHLCTIPTFKRKRMDAPHLPHIFLKLDHRFRALAKLVHEYLIFPIC